MFCRLEQSIQAAFPRFVRKKTTQAGFTQKKAQKMSPFGHAFTAVPFGRGTVSWSSCRCGQASFVERKMGSIWRVPQMGPKTRWFIIYTVYSNARWFIIRIKMDDISEIPGHMTSNNVMIHWI